MDWKWLLFGFDGRINRAKWWLVVLILVIASVIVWFVILPILGFSVWSTGSTTTAAVISLIVTLIFAWPATAAMVKRLKDRDRPMWLVAVFWAPTVLTLLAQVFGLAGTPQEIEGQPVMMPTTLGWVLNLLTFVIGIWALVELGILKGTPGPNRHGPDPLARA
jgi:uncharacterized membrane protein YhaH (DUF805 family)